MLLPYLVAFGVLLHVLFWGAGLAALVMPGRWRAFWPVLAAPAGMALQSLVVWMGAHTHLAGTDAYAWPAEAIPVLLFVAGLGRRRYFGLRDVGRFAGVALITAGCLACLVRPLVQAASGLTTASLGSCDAADYAAGARVLKEFASNSRAGFIGLKEVVRLMSVDNFFDFWLRLNHFTPSALIAFNGTLFNCSPYELTGLATMALFAGSIPVVFWTSRALFGYRKWMAMALTVLFGISPLTWYAVYQVATAQLIAAPAIALITWAGVELWRRGPRPGRGRRFGGILFVAYALVLGSYNFIVVVCLVPALTYAGALAWWGGQWRRLGPWMGRMLVPLALAGSVFWDRVAGLVERFSLFRTYDFGWRIPGLSPEGWLGVVSGTGLAPIAGGWRPFLALLPILLLAEALRRGIARGDRRVPLVLGTLLPVLFGYGYLLWRGAHFRTNASYDAYKLFSVFYPVFLPALCFWVTLARRFRTAMGMAVAALGLAVAAGNARAAHLFIRAEENPPLIVDRDLADIRRVENMIGVGSLNLRLPDMWSRLWANAFLLRKAQYFLTHTYEGRRNTALRGEWDLNDGLIFVSLPNGASQALNSQYSLVRVAGPCYVRVALRKGWYELERLPRTSIRWRWSTGRPSFRVNNPQSRPLHAVLSLDICSTIERDVQLWSHGRELGAGRVGRSKALLRFPDVTLPPGDTFFELRSSQPPDFAPGDMRPLGIALYGLHLEVLR